MRENFCNLHKRKYKNFKGKLRKIVNIYDIPGHEPIKLNPFQRSRNTLKFALIITFSPGTYYYIEACFQFSVFNISMKQCSC